MFRTILLLVLLGTTPGWASAQPGVVVPPGSAEARLNSGAQPLPLLLRALEEQYKINVVAETHPTDVPVRFIVPSDGRASAADVLHQLADRAGRDIIEVDGVYVLRDRQATRKSIYDIGPATDVRYSDDAVTVSVLDSRVQDVGLPAKRVNVIAPDNTVKEITDGLQKGAHVSVRADSTLAARRICLFARNVPPTAIMDALGTLLDAGPEVVLRRTDAQSQRLADEKQYGKDSAERLSLSRALYEGTNKLLTKEQQQQRQAGQFIEIPLSQLSPALQKQALEYIKFSALQDRDLISPPDMSRWQDFALRFRPPGTGADDLLGITVNGSDGTLYSF